MSCAWGREGKVVSRTEGNIRPLVELLLLTVEAEGTKSTVVTCAEIVRSHHLQEV